MSLCVYTFCTFEVNDKIDSREEPLRRGAPSGRPCGHPKGVAVSRGKRNEIGTNFPRFSQVMKSSMFYIKLFLLERVKLRKLLIFLY